MTTAHKANRRGIGLLVVLETVLRHLQAVVSPRAVDGGAARGSYREKSRQVASVELNRIESIQVGPQEVAR
ncbi:MAG: hypothetical protein HY814_06650 [Candidatus Riflebacteria bacterium]|nr:hypothetical protein [Candidatus Riflebacteria bacterium]